MTDDPMSIDDATETHPDIPPIVDEQGYEAARQYVAMLEQRGVTSDTRNEQGALLLKLRRAMELYRQTPVAKLEMDIHVLRMERDNAESEADAARQGARVWEGVAEKYLDQVEQLKAQLAEMTAERDQWKFKAENRGNALLSLLGDEPAPKG